MARVITRKPEFLLRPISRQFVFSKPNNKESNLLSLLRQLPSKKPLLLQIHTQMLINSIEQPNYLLSKAIDLKDFSYASNLFSQIPNPNDFTFNIMIRGLTSNWQKYSLALQFFYKMKGVGLKPNKFTFPFLFISCSNLGTLIDGKLGHCMVFKVGVCRDGHVNHSLITMYAKCGQLGFARKVFDEISERDLVSWNSIISGYSQMGSAKEAVEVFEMMEKAGFEPNEMTLVSALAACGDLGDLRLGRKIEDFVAEKGMKLNFYIGSALINMYGKCGDLVSARRIFDTMEKRDIVSWNAMISVYAQNGASDEAIKLFYRLRETGMNLNNITLVTALSACASIGALDLGNWIETYSIQRGVQHDIYVGSALVDMYAKCGSLDNARRVFEGMPMKNEVSWNSMISAFAHHGQAQEALSLFWRMSEENSNIRPNDITFVGVLSACVHAGLVDEGRHLFKIMTTCFGLIPQVEHYSCMVDLLARAGHIYEAWDLVEKMPGKPDEIVLGALLGACQKQKNADITDRVSKLLIDVEPSNSGNYVISSKIYAKLRRWDDSANMRVLMRERGVSKTPGCSWIEIGAQVHEFHAGDDLEFQSSKLFELLNDEMKREGYVPRPDL